MEKLNDLTSRDYFVSTNKNNDYLKQLLMKRNRIEYMNQSDKDYDIYNILDLED